MKKTVLKLLSLTLALLMLTGALSSCMKIGLALLGEEKDARLLLRALENATAKSYTITTESKLSVTVGKYNNSVLVTGDFTEYQVGSKDYRYHVELSTETVINGNYTEIETLEGFQDGKMYSGYDQAADEGFVYSEISRKDYVKHMEEMELRNSFSFDINEKNCSKITCVKNDDKTTTATYSGFTQKGLDQFFELLDVSPDTFGEGLEIEDILMTLTVDKKLRPKMLRLDLLFDVSNDFAGEDPAMYLEMSFQLDDVKAPHDIDFSEYEQVEDLRLADQVEKQLSELIDKEEGYFSTKVVQKVSSGNQSEHDSMIYNGVYRNEDGVYTHEIKVKDGTALYKTGKLVYEDGKQEATGIVALMEQSMTDHAAKEWLGSLLNPASFDSSRISGITLQPEDGDGVYMLDLADPKGTHPVASAIGLEISNSREWLKVTVEDGKVVGCEHYLYLRGSVGKVSISVTVTTTSTFSDEPIEESDE